MSLFDRLRGLRYDPCLFLYLYVSSAMCVFVFVWQVQTGEFGAMMEVSLVNDGPVTLLFDSRDRTDSSGSTSAAATGRKPRAEDAVEE